MQCQCVGFPVLCCVMQCQCVGFPVLCDAVSQCVGFPVLCDTVSQVLPFSDPLVEVIFLLELTKVLTPFPKTSFG